MSAHACDALVVFCIDFRFQRYLRKWTDKNLKNQTFDLVGFAGSTKNIRSVMKQINLSIKLHNVKKVILINHEDCGAYGAENFPDTIKEFARHREDLTRASKKIHKLYPEISIDTFFLHLNGWFDIIK